LCFMRGRGNCQIAQENKPSEAEEKLFRLQHIFIWNRN
jgi:hypothetical protein